MNKVSDHMGVGVAHSKIILVGEHMVVHGKPAIALPFPLHIKTEISRYEGEIVIESQLYTGVLSQMPERLKGIERLILDTITHLKQEVKDMKIKIFSEIPIGQGLGSSAAAGVSVVRALFNYFSEILERKDLERLVNQAEVYAHGKPSGIDMMTVLSDWPIYFVLNNEIEVLEKIPSFYFVVGDTGNPGDTKTAVSNVGDLKQQNPEYMNEIMCKIEEIVIQSKEAMEVGDLDKLGILLSLNHLYLKKLHVSDNLLDQLVDEAKLAGALGAKMTGGGLGGCMIALAQNKEDAIDIGTKLLQAGASNAWCFETNGEAYEVKLEDH